MDRRNFIKSLAAGSLIGVLPAQAKPLSPSRESPVSAFISEEASWTPGFRKSWLSPDYTFASLEVGESNNFAYGIAQMIASEVIENRLALHNPLVLYGDSGVGKTHIVHAIANEVLQRAPERAVHSVHTMDLIDDVILAYRNNSIADLRHIYQGVDLLCLDDAHCLSSDLRVQQMLCQVVDALLDTNRHIVMSSATRLDEIAALDDGLIARLGSGMWATIKQPDLQMRVRILKREAEMEKIHLEDDVARFIAGSIKDTNVRLMQGALKRVIAFSRFHGCSISINTASAALQDLL